MDLLTFWWITRFDGGSSPEIKKSRDFFKRWGLFWGTENFQIIFS